MTQQVFTLELPLYFVVLTSYLLLEIENMGTHPRHVHTDIELFPLNQGLCLQPHGFCTIVQEDPDCPTLIMYELRLRNIHIYIYIYRLMRSSELGLLSRLPVNSRSEFPHCTAGQQIACSVLSDKCALGQREARVLANLPAPGHHSPAHPGSGIPWTPEGS